MKGPGVRAVDEWERAGEVGLTATGAVEMRGASGRSEAAGGHAVGNWGCGRSGDLVQAWKRILAKER